ncbi:MAG: hypothetical protein KAT15_04720, partial [Bacteroidales bacterium]|nr:hypothetical protein [Bacteroidales bacterium]
RKVILHTSFATDDSEKTTDEEGHEWQEGIVVYHPHTNPEEYLHLDAVHVANMKGESGKWSWEKAGEPTTPTPEGSNIVMMNMRSEFKPFIISEEGCELAAYEGAQGGSHFRWRDHWPTTTEPTPGRNASGKQAAHGSFFHVLNIPYHKREPGRLTKIMLHGLTKTPVEGFVPVARSWLDPPDLVLESHTEQVKSEGYNPAERAFILNIAVNDGPMEIKLKIAASPQNPAVNPVFVLNNWNGKRPGIVLNDTSLEYGNDYTSGMEDVLGSSRCVIWLNKQLTSTGKIVIHQEYVKTNDQ